MQLRQLSPGFGRLKLQWSASDLKRTFPDCRRGALFAGFTDGWQRTSNVQPKNRGRSIPAVRVLGKSRSLHSHDAESLPGGSLHDHPSFQATDDDGAEPFQAKYLSGYVIGLYVDVDPALVADPLNLHDRFVGWRLQHTVVATSARMIGIYRTPQCLGPEAGGLIHVRMIAVDQHSAQS